MAFCSHSGTAWFVALVFALVSTPACIGGSGECAGGLTVEVSNQSSQPLRIIAPRPGYFDSPCSGLPYPLPDDFILEPGQTVVIACGGALGAPPQAWDLVPHVEIRDTDDATLASIDLAEWPADDYRDVAPSAAGPESCHAYVATYSVDERLWAP